MTARRVEIMKKKKTEAPLEAGICGDFAPNAELPTKENTCVRCNSLYSYPFTNVSRHSKWH